MAAADYECAIHAYMLMTNHVHLLLTPGNADSLPLSEHQSPRPPCLAAAERLPAE